MNILGKNLVILILLLKNYFLLAVPLLISNEDNPPVWSWVYMTKHSASLSIIPKTNVITLMDQKNIPSFNQLIFSWNAFRPERGYFSFYAQVRDKATQKWGVWHYMYDWGANGVQRSHKRESDGISYYEYVRLEMEPNQRADAFRIKVQLQEGAPLRLLQGVTAAVSAYDLFKPEDPHRFVSLGSVYLPAVPKIAQFALNHPHKDRVCSPVSLTMLLQSLGYYDLVVEKVMVQSYDNGLNAYGSWPFNVAHAFECTGGEHRFYVCRLNSFKEIQQQLLKGIPVVVSVRGPLPGAERPYNQGHLLVIVGWDQEKQAVICHDPAFDDPHKTLKYYPIAPFLLAWERSRRLTYWTIKQ